MRRFATKLAGAFASLFFAFALLAVSGQEAKAQFVTITPAPGLGCCFNIFTNIPAAGAGIWKKVEITRTAGPVITGVGGSGIAVPVFAPLPDHDFLVSNPAPFFPTGAGVFVGTICVTGGGNTTLVFHLQRLVGGVWVNGPNKTYIVNCGPNGPYIVDMFKESGYEEGDNTMAFSGSGMTASPNPASGQTVLRFESAQELSGTVLSITDMTGREVLRVLDGATLAEGGHEIAVNTESLNSGIYMVNLRSDNGTVITTKFSVLR